MKLIYAIGAICLAIATYNIGKGVGYEIGRNYDPAILRATSTVEWLPGQCVNYDGHNRASVGKCPQ